MMVDLLDRHTLVKVVGIDSDLEQAIHQLSQGFNRVIDATQQHCLVIDGNSCAAQPVHCFSSLLGNFIRMIEVGRHIERLIAIEIGKQINQFVIKQAHGKNDRSA